jgi:hypothetical protein
VRLEGAWVGQIPGAAQWSHILTPLDPEAQSAAVKVQWVTWAGFAGLLNFVGADSMSEAVGEHQMIKRDTSKYTLIYYAVKSGPSPEIKGVFILSGVWHFTSPDAVVSHETLALYAPADIGPDGAPKPGAVPMVPAIPIGPTYHYRVPILPPVPTS